MIDETRPKRRIRDELRPLWRLAWPVIIGEIGWMVMGIVDTFMVGPSPEAIGAVSVGSALHFAIALLATGVLLGLDPIVSQAFGANRLEDGRRALVQGLWLSVILTAPMMGIQWLLADRLIALGINPDVAPLAASYLRIMSWSTLPLSVFAAFRHYLQATATLRPMMIALVTANFVNWFGNYLFIRGHWGLPALGVDGSAISTLFARVYMAGLLAFATVLRERNDRRAFWRLGWAIDIKRMRSVMTLGLPAAIQLVLEVGVFAAATTLVGRLSADALAAHQIVLNLSGLTFMVPLGIASAGSVRVGHEIGRGDGHGAALAGWTAIAVGVCVMIIPAALMVLFPRTIAMFFIQKSDVVVYIKKLLLIVAAYQLFDGLQVTTTGSLRGVGDTRTSMFTGLVSYWFIGLPFGAFLGLSAGYGVFGIWTGLSLGLMITGLVLVRRWAVKAQRLRTEGASMGLISRGG